MTLTKRGKRPESLEGKADNKTKKRRIVSPSQHAELPTKGKLVHFYLEQHGIPLLTKSDVKNISKGKIQRLGVGAYGACYKVVDPNTLQTLVIKSFFGREYNCLINEARNLHELQISGVQRLVGVSVEARQIITEFAGVTATRYFTRRTSFADTISVFLQIARTLRAMLQEGYVHNDLKDDNICVHVDKSVPKATVIDLGMARAVGTYKVYTLCRDTDAFPWIAPELLLHSEPCSEASDVYSLAHLMNTVLSLRKRHALNPSIAALKEWLWRAQMFHPSERPRLTALIHTLEVLHQEAMQGPSSE